MAAPISALTATEKENLFRDLNYLNLREIKTYCKKRKIPYRILIQDRVGVYKTSSEDDRKGVILDRIRHYLLTGAVLPATRFPWSVVNADSSKKALSAGDQLYYGQYQKHGPMLDLLARLTGAKFKSGAIARSLARHFWGQGIAPTYQAFADAWLIAVGDHKRPNPEWAFLSDRSDGKDTVGWKHVRNEKARLVLKVLNEL